MVNIGHPIQFIVNLLALTIFPFVTRPMVSAVGNVDEATFMFMMQGRKKLIPTWIKAMYKAEK